MTLADRINNDYFEWMFEVVCEKRYPKEISYRKLLTLLHSMEFTYTIPRDENRAADGVDLRWRFAYLENCRDLYEYLEGPCSVLEMMIALSIRCENMMDDPRKGDRTAQWFWGMITNLGLGAMHDANFDKKYVESAVERFLNREYEPNGEGGLFTVRNRDTDLRTVEIWYQLCWYLDSIEF